MQKLTLSLLPQQYAVSRLDPNGHIPSWALIGDDFISLTRTRAELSVICLQENVPLEGTSTERDWCCLRVNGPFDLSVAGVHVSLAVPLAEANISSLSIATYETDHLLVKKEDLDRTIQTLVQAGHQVLR